MKQIDRVASDDALTTIYRLSREADVIAARVAERLGVTPPSAGAMIRRLVRDGYVALDGSHHIQLTELGLVRARQMVRRHRLAECLLVTLLGLDWWRAHEEAHLLEHAISDVTEPLLAARLGFPTVSPFGYPIPTSDCDGETSSIRLQDLHVGYRGAVERVYDEDETLLQFFDQHGIRPGAVIEIVDATPALEMTTVRIGPVRTVLTSRVTGLTWMQPEVHASP